MPSAAMVVEQWLLVRFCHQRLGIPRGWSPIPFLHTSHTMYPVNLRRSTGRISGGRHTPTSGCATSNLVKSRRPCMYPGHGGFLCAGMIGQKRNSFMARLMICACNWSVLGIPKTRHQMCAPMGNIAMCSSKYSCVWAVPATVPALAFHPTQCTERPGTLGQRH